MRTAGTSISTHEDLIADALVREPTGMTINRVRGRCGGSVSLTGQALLSLERQGRGRFERGLWYPVPAVVRPEPEHGFVAGGAVAAAGRVRKQWVA